MTQVSDEIDARAFAMSRVFEAPRADVFRAWTDAAALMELWARRA